MSKSLKKVFELSFVIIAIIAVFIIVFMYYYVRRNKDDYCLIVSEAVKNTELTDSLIFAVIAAESGFDKNAVSAKNAKGLMQLTDETFSFVSRSYSLGYTEKDVFNVEANVTAGTMYLDYLYKKFGDLGVAIAAYNAGEGNVSLWLKDKRYSGSGVVLDEIPFAETKYYVKRVLFFKRIFEVL